jgi:hypothetical protein
LDDPALHAASTAMHEADFGEAGGCRSRNVLVNDRGNIARRERMKVEFSLDGNMMHAALARPSSLDLSPWQSLAKVYKGLRSKV